MTLANPLRRLCPVCQQQAAQVIFQPSTSPGPVSKCLTCALVYVATVTDDHALIVDGPVIYNQIDNKILTSANLEDVKDSWELHELPDKLAELPTLQRNASEALLRLEKIRLEKVKNEDSRVEQQGNQRKILDFGSGWGFFLAAAKKQGWDAYGLEPLPASAVYARATYGLPVTTDILRDHSFPCAFFDVITAFQVFEHLPNPSEDLRRLHRFLRKNGLLLIEVPNIETWTLRLMGSRHRHFVQDHLNFFSAQTLSRLLETNGFVVEDVYYPTRRMSVRHLVTWWGKRFLPAALAQAAQVACQKMGLWERSLPLNVGDIVAVIARKI